MRAFVPALLLVGCGRVSFDPRTDPLTDARIVDTGAETAADAPEPSLVAHLRFDDDPTDGVLDSTGHGHDGTCQPQCPTLVPGIRGMAYELDGATMGVAIPDDASLNLSVLTVTAWVMETVDTGADQAIVGKALETDNANTWQLGIAPTLFAFICSTQTTGAGLCLGSNPGAVQRGQWMHFAYVHDGTMERGYLDGVEFDFGPVQLGYDTHPILIGVDSDFGAFINYVHGLIDDVRIYDRVLTPSEIQQLATP